jgi:chromosome segregation ATPase
MDESTLRRIITEVVRDEVKSVRDEVKSVRDEVKSVRDDMRAFEERLAEGGRLQFRQLSELYRSTLEKVEHLEKHLGERIDVTRGAIESLRSTIERQDFRTDELARRVTTIETRPPAL